MAADTSTSFQAPVHPAFIAAVAANKATTDRIQARVDTAFAGELRAAMIERAAEQATASLISHYKTFIGGIHANARRSVQDEFCRWFGRALEGGYTGDMLEGAELFEAVAFRTVWCEYGVDVQAFWGAVNASAKAKAVSS